MRKPWVYKRPGRPGYYVGWYDGEGGRRAKCLPNKRLADDYAARLRHELNADLYPQAVSVPWHELVERYIEHKQVIEGKKPATIRQYENTLAMFKNLVGPVSSSQFKQTHVNQYIKARKQPQLRKDGTEYTTSAATINKDLRQLQVFVRWAVGSRLMGEPARRIQWYRQKEEGRPVRALNARQIVAVLASAHRFYGMPWVVRILLSLGTALRQEDVEAIRIEDIHPEDNTIASRSKKSNKVSAYRPVHPLIIRIVSQYAEGRKELFPDKYHHNKWERIRKDAGVTEYKYHDLRRSFSSFLAQAGFSTSVIQDLLEHSTPIVTAGYVNTNPVHREAADSIPADAIIESLVRQVPGLPVAKPECPPDDTGSSGPS